MTYPRTLWSKLLHPLAAIATLAALALPAAAQVADNSDKLQMSAAVQEAATKAPARMIVVLAQPTANMSMPAQARLSALRTDTVAEVDGFIARSNARGLMGGRMDSRIGRRYDYFPFLAMELSLAEAKALAADSSVARIVEDTETHLSLDVSVPLVKAPQVWANGPEGAGQTVVILDTGADLEHTMLAGKAVASICFSSNSSTLRTVCPDGSTQMIGGHAGDDCTLAVPSGTTGCDHGTHVASIAAGRAVAVSGTLGGQPFSATLRGVAPSANIVAAQVFSYKASENTVVSSSSDQIAAFNWLLPRVAQLNIASINMSLGGDPFSGACDTNILKAPIDQMRAVGVLTAIASGNDGSTVGASTPACITNAMTVGATDDNDAVATFSNSGTQLDLWAPGVSILAAIPGATATSNGSFASKSGTSMSTPHVAGAIALLKSAKPSATAAEIENLLKTTGPNVTDARNALVRPRLDTFAAWQGLNVPVLPRLQVTPEAVATFSVAFGSAPSPTSRTYSVTNPAGSSTNVHVQASNANITLSVGGAQSSTLDFALAAGATQLVTVTPASNLPLEVVTSEVAFTSTGGATINRGVRIDVQNPLTVTPATVVTLVGNAGGPFRAVESTNGTDALYVVNNSAASAVPVTASSDQSWVTLSANGQVGQSIQFSAAATPAGTNVTAAANTAANSFGLGVQHATLTFSAGSNAIGSRALDLRVTVPNDFFINATLMPQKAGQANPSVLQASGSNVNSFYENGEPSHVSGNLPRRSVWWKFTPTQSGSVQVDTIGSQSGFDTVLAVYTGNLVNALTPIASNDDIDTAGGITTSRLSFSAVAGTTYLVALDGFSAATGNYVINVTPLAASNDLQANAQTISGAAGSVSVSTTGATRSAGEVAHDGATDGRSVWFRWVAPGPGSANFLVSGATVDMSVSAYLVSSDGGLIEVGSDPGGGSPRNGFAPFQAITGRTYFIVVDSPASGPGGSGTLQWDTGGVSKLVASVLPSSRRTVIGRPVTIFANMINTGSTTLNSCAFAKPYSFLGTFSYQTANASNQLTGSPNTNVSIPAGGIQNFVLTATPNTTISSGELGLSYSCVGDYAGPVYPGTNTWLLRVDAGASTPDVIAIGATVGTPGVVTVPVGGAAAFSVASVNIGSASSVITLQETAPAGVQVTACETNPSTAACLAPPAAIVAIPSFATNEVHTFSVFVQNAGSIPVTFDPANNRIGAVFKDASGNIYGATSVAVRTQ